MEHKEVTRVNTVNLMVFIWPFTHFRPLLSVKLCLNVLLLCEDVILHAALPLVTRTKLAAELKLNC